MIFFLLKRLMAGILTLLIITFVLYAITLLVPAEERARPYLSARMQGADMEDIRAFIDQTIERYGLDDPLPIQYSRWLGRLVQGDWGYSPTLRTEVLPAILHRSPATLELTLFALLIYIPLGLVFGTLAAWRQGRLLDRASQFTSFALIAIPPFILGLVLIAIVYVQLGLFDLSRIGYAEGAIIRSEDFWQATGLITVDGLLNGRPDITWEALRHLVLPATTLAALHLATLFQVTRSGVVEELQRDYINLAKSMGLGSQRILFGHALKNALLPAFTHAAVTATQLVTGVFVVEVVFNWHGVSELVVDSLGLIPDVNLALGLSIYSVLVVLALALLLEMIQGLIDPRLRLGGK
jgi:peptide/nickel transport system permease protein